MSECEQANKRVNEEERGAATEVESRIALWEWMVDEISKLNAAARLYSPCLFAYVR